MFGRNGLRKTGKMILFINILMNMTALIALMEQHSLEDKGRLTGRKKETMLQQRVLLLEQRLAAMEAEPLL